MRVRLARTGDELEACRAVRLAVLVHELGILPSSDADGCDPECVHFFAEVQGEVVGAARLFLGPASARAERLAVVAEHRRRGLGGELLEAMEAVARLKGHAVMTVRPPQDAGRFFVRRGYRAEGRLRSEGGRIRQPLLKLL